MSDMIIDSKKLLIFPTTQFRLSQHLLSHGKATDFSQNHFCWERKYVGFSGESLKHMIVRKEEFAYIVKCLFIKEFNKNSL